MARSIRLSFDTSQEVPSVLSITLLFSLAFLVAWLSVTMGDHIVAQAQISPVLGLRAAEELGGGAVR